MDRLLYSETPIEYFREVVEKVMARQNFRSSELSSFYLVKLLDNFVAIEQCEAGPEATLAELYCEALNPNRKIFEARKRETAALGAGEKLVLGHPLAATIGDSARCMQNLEKVLFTGPKTSDTVTFICD